MLLTYSEQVRKGMHQKHIKNEKKIATGGIEPTIYNNDCNQVLQFAVEYR